MGNGNVTSMSSLSKKVSNILTPTKTEGGHHGGHSGHHEDQINRDRQDNKWVKDKIAEGEVGDDDVHAFEPIQVYHSDKGEALPQSSELSSDVGSFVKIKSTLKTKRVESVEEYVDYLSNKI